MIQDIKYMDINHYNDLISKNDYLGAATYAKGFTSNDPIQRRNLEKGVGMLESEGRKYQAIINKAKPDQKDAVSFLYGLKTGSLDLRKGKDGQYINRYVREFKDTINKEMGTTIIMATQDREIVNEMKKHVIALKDGRLVKDFEKGTYDNELV